MRILIYLLAMLTGFSAAEAARPVSAVPASVDAAVGQAYVAVAVKIVKQGQVRAVSDASFCDLPSDRHPIVDAFSSVETTTPVLRHDVILG